MKQHPTKGWRLGRGYGVKRDVRTLHLTKYLERLPAPPPSITHSGRITAPLGMMGNDQYGDCVVAAAGHMRLGWEANAGAAQLVPTDAQIIAAYLAVSGGQDTGLYPIDWLNYWRKTGLAGDKIEGFAATDAGNLLQAKLAIQIFGSHFIGMSLPDTNTFGPWNVASPTWAPDPNNGHMVCLLDYDDASKMFMAVSWGELMLMSYGWFAKYCDEAYAVLDDIELIASSGLTPEGFNLAQLQDDIAHVKDPITPIVPPTPPGPAPTVGDVCIYFPTAKDLVGPFADDASAFAWAKAHFPRSHLHHTLKLNPPT